MNYQVKIIDCVTRKPIKEFGFEGAVCRGRTPLETAWDLARLFVDGGDYFVVLVKPEAAA